MNKVAKFFWISASVLIVAGCVGTQLDKAQRMGPEGSSEFNVGLYQGYINLSSSEYNEGDYRDSDTFAVRAMDSSAGGTVAPEEINARNLPEGKVGELTSARQRLVEAFGQGAAEIVPTPAARAQTSFDCWMQEQEENFQPDDIEACRSQFFAALEQIEASLKPKPMAKKVEPPPAPANQLYVVYFDFDGAGISDAAKAVLETAGAAAEKLKGVVTISGHTDLAGSGKYNLELSERRVQAVSDALFRAGVSSAAIKTEALGETRPAIKTPDGIAESGNRRVEIFVRVK